MGKGFIRGTGLGFVLGLVAAFYAIQSWHEEPKVVERVVTKIPTAWEMRNACVKWWFNNDPKQLEAAQKFMCGER